MTYRVFTLIFGGLHIADFQTFNEVEAYLTTAGRELRGNGASCQWVEELFEGQWYTRGQWQAR